MTDPSLPGDDLFDAEAVYDTELAPLVDQVIALCKKHRLPLVLSVCYARDGESPSFCTSSTTRGNWQPLSMRLALAHLLSGATPV